MLHYYEIIEALFHYYLFINNSYLSASRILLFSFIAVLVFIIFFVFYVDNCFIFLGVKTLDLFVFFIGQYIGMGHTGVWYIVKLHEF